jgi:uncharacterized membrane protein YphA (DoxX/SURF4 family)
MLFAHVKWFVSESGAPSLTTLEAAVAGIVVILGLIILWYVDRFTGSMRWTRVEPRTAWRWLPWLVRVSTGVMLLFNTRGGVLFAPNFSAGAGSQVLSWLFTVAGVLLIFGLFTRLTGGLLIIGWLAGFGLFPALDMFDHLEYVGVGLFLISVGGGVWSLDDRVRLLKLPSKRQVSDSAQTLQIWIGVALVALALSEKLLAPELSEAFLGHHSWNLLHYLGVSNRWFVVIAGSIELVVGLAFVLGWAPRLVSLALVGLMTTTAILLGIDEVVGHLFALSLVGSLWLLAPKRLRLPNF